MQNNYILKGEDNKSSKIINEERNSCNKELNISSFNGMNLNSKKITIYFGSKNPLLVNNERFGNNIIKTTKYTPLTLIPKSLFYQMCHVSNIYFLIVSILSCLSFSPKSPATMIGTFVFVLVFTMCKDGLVDYNRYLQDKKSNNSLCDMFLNDKWIKDMSFKIKPGNIIKLKENEESSCDILIIKSSNTNGYIYIDTKNLDGETNLKEKCSIEPLKNYNFDNEDELAKFSGNVKTTQSDANLNSWEGYLNSDLISNYFCSIDNLLLRGSVLKNTEYIYGLVIYSGHNTKIMKNSNEPKPKTSKMIKTMDILLYSLFVFIFILCIIFSILSCKFISQNKNFTYLFYKYGENKSSNKTSALFIKYFLIFFIDYYQVIPISLYVVMEIIKIYQGYLIYYDYKLYDFVEDRPSDCREYGLIEELGQINFLFSDKTGTLTKNEMFLKKIFVNGKVYGAEKETNEYVDKINTINGDFSAYEVLSQKLADKDHIERLFMLLCTCHSVFPNTINESVFYQGSSPDEIALIKGARQLGYEFREKNFNELVIYDRISEETISFNVGILIPFDSDRKRMTVVAKNNNNKKFYIFSKGSDNMMLEKIKESEPIINEFNYSDEKLHVNKILEHFGKEGLRILVMGYKEVSEELVNQWNSQIKEYKMHSPQKLIDVYQLIEKNLIFCGCTAIEDKLQEDVPETIKTLNNCGIKIWILTGDKKETAKQIAKECTLIDNDMKIYDLSNEEYNKEGKLYEYLNNLCEELQLIKWLNYFKNDKFNFTINEIERKFKNNPITENVKISLIVEGNTLNKILFSKKLAKLFFLLGSVSLSVVCCRVTPMQKSMVVNLIKSFGDYITCSIGDGANDVPMIMSASIGIGIQGKEGTQAARTADYSIGQFRFLERLILFYGRNGYKKIAEFILYYFYKNILLVVTELIFVFYNGYSGQIFFPDWYGTMFNAIFTSWPCIFLFVYEKELPENICNKFPIIYDAGPKNVYFNIVTFWKYIILGLFHSLMCFIIPAYSLNSVVDDKGNTFNNWIISTVSFCLIIHVVSIKLLLISNYINWINLFFTFFSVILFYLILFILCLYKVGKFFQPEAIGIFTSVMKNTQSLLIIFFGPFIILLPDIIISEIKCLFFPNPSEYLMVFSKDSDFLKIMDDQRVALTATGKIKFEKETKKIAEGYQKLRNKFQKLRKTNTMMNINKSTRSKLNVSKDISMNNSMHQIKSASQIIIDGKFKEDEENCLNNLNKVITKKSNNSEFSADNFTNREKIEKFKKKLESPKKVQKNKDINFKRVNSIKYNCSILKNKYEIKSDIDALTGTSDIANQNKNLKKNKFFKHVSFKKKVVSFNANLIKKDD